MSPAGIGSQYVEEIGKFGHGNRVEGSHVTELFPMFLPTIPTSTTKVDIMLCGGKSGS